MLDDFSMIGRNHCSFVVVGARALLDEGFVLCVFAWEPFFEIVEPRAPLCFGCVPRRYIIFRVVGIDHRAGVRAL